MEEKVAQGGWPHFAPARLPQRQEHAHPGRRPGHALRFVRHAFERYATGLVSLADLRDELYAMGLRTELGQEGRRLGDRQDAQEPDLLPDCSATKACIYPGAHEPLVSRELFDAVQDAFAPNRHGNNSAKKRSYVLSDFLVCAECGAKITAGTHKGHVYYRCTHGKGECSQRSYIREELLMQEVAEVLAASSSTPRSSKRWSKRRASWSGRARRPGRESATRSTSRSLTVERRGSTLCSTTCSTE